MLLGALAGDIIGSPYEFNNIKTKEFPLISGRSIFTDDSVMTLAIAHALTKWRKGSDIDEAEFEKAVIDSMQKFGRRYPHASYGGHFKRWLKDDDPTPYNSWGNGSAMRVSPVAWYFDDLETVEKFAEITARPTHNHPEGIKGAQATAAAIFMARTGSTKDEIKAYITNKYNYDLTLTLDDIRPYYEFDVSCPGSVPEAIMAFLEASDFEDSIRNAISIGGDSDTIAAITGAISQGMWGIPESIEKLIRPKLDEFLNRELDNFYKALAGEKIPDSDLDFDSDSKPHEKVKNGITEIVFILDRSGSMSGLEADTIGGFNSMIEKQKSEPGEAIVSTVLFDHVTEVLHDRVKLSDIKPMTRSEYFVRGNTALLDAIGGSINHIGNIHKYARPADVPEKTIFVIITDGYENASRNFTREKIKALIENQKSKYSWEFLFIGANIDAVTAAQDIGISANRAVNYVADSAGTDVVYDSVSDAMSEARSESGEISENWCAEIAMDYDRRGRNRYPGIWSLWSSHPSPPSPPSTKQTGNDNSPKDEVDLDEIINLFKKEDI